MDDKSLERINELTFRFITGVISADEQKELDDWLDSDPTHRQRFMERLDHNNTYDGQHALEEGNRLGRQLKEDFAFPITPKTPPVRKMYSIRWLWFASGAAAVLFFLGLYYYQSPLTISPIPSASTPVVNLPPGSTKAVLLLADGSQIRLDSSHNRVLGQQGGSTLKNGDGSLTYHPGGSPSGNVVYNTLITPPGGQYSLTLPDNTVVMLNASSSIKYPTSFNGDNRQVELTGEAFFDVAADARHPFTVITGKVKVKVLGTRFNLMAYGDENEAKATLLKGAIAVSSPAGSASLKPGQEASLGSQVIIRQVDTAKATAWKDGYFYFEGADIRTVMRAASRWYNVDVVFDSPVSDKLLYGRVSRQKSFEKFSEVLQASGYNIKIEGRKTIRVLPEGAVPGKVGPVQ